MARQAVTYLRRQVRHPRFSCLDPFLLLISGVTDPEVGLFAAGSAVVLAIIWLIVIARRVDHAGRVAVTVVQMSALFL